MTEWPAADPKPDQAIPEWANLIPEVAVVQSAPPYPDVPSAPTPAPTPVDVLAELGASLEPAAEWMPPLVQEAELPLVEPVVQAWVPSEVMPVAAPMSVPAQTVEPASISEPVTTVEPTPIVEPMPTMDPEPTVNPVPTVQPALNLEPISIVEPEPEPVAVAQSLLASKPVLPLNDVGAQSVPTPLQMSEPVVATLSLESSAGSDLSEDTFWESMFREQSDLASVVSTLHPAPATVPTLAPTPTLTSAPSPTPPPAPTSAPTHAPAPAHPVSAPEAQRIVIPPAAAVRPPRPKTVVRSLEQDARLAQRKVPLEPLAATQPTADSTAGRSKLDEIVMAAPVEMWFGESRIGVKAGTKTYAQFRKYADVLFADLHEAKNRNR